MIQRASPYRPLPTTIRTLCVFRIFPTRVTYPILLHSPHSLSCNFAHPLAIPHSQAKRALTIQDTSRVNTDTWKECEWDRRTS